MPKESNHPAALLALTQYRQLVTRGVDRTVALVAVMESAVDLDDDAAIGAALRVLLAQQEADLIAERETVNRQFDREV